jgi:hypothetical protein
MTPQSKNPEAPKRDEKGRLLKGSSGNPGGLSKWQRKLVKALESKAAPLAADLLVKVLGDKEGTYEVAEQLKAADIALKYTAPRPQQRVDVTSGGKEVPSPLAGLTPEQLLALVKGGK